MYRLNKNVKYKSNRGRWDEPVKDLQKQDIYVNLHEHIQINFPNMFIKLKLPDWDSNSEQFKRWGYGDYMTYWQSQLCFAVHCSTTALGISAHMLNDHTIPPMVRSILRFHAYYHIRRILFRLQSPLPFQDGFDAENNNYSKSAFAEICSEYGADPDALYKFESNFSAWDERGKSYFKIDDRDWAK